MEALVEDIVVEAKPTPPVAKPAPEVNRQSEAKADPSDDGQSADVSMVSATTAQSQASNDPVADMTSELKQKFNIDALQQEKEAEIQKYVV